MPVRTGKDGRPEYYRDDMPIFKNLDKAYDFLTGRFRKEKVEDVQWPEDPYEGYSYASSSCSCTEEHSCSPEECTTCKDKDCPNRYDDFISDEEFKL